ncbi:MAG: bifunctional precorrin-2 dehydrogenase/sirohydrochlorin ferrochelatase, partial [Gammaproteobacteria bacterium]|nr:bifunctional precorrin-2 dehydrogenase/sirohydrochlorin ferrochelatase [Gammaproteobacteria bacterium]
MNYFPVFLDIKNRLCLVVGAGNIAARKIELLAKAGASVKVVAIDINSAVKSLIAEFSFECEQREFQESDIDGMSLVISATDNNSLNRRISEIAQSKQIPVNVVDSPELCSFITPSMIDRDPIQIAISTGGSSPVLARHIRTKLESTIPSGYGELAGLFSKYRESVQ